LSVMIYEPRVKLSIGEGSVFMSQIRVTEGKEGKKKDRKPGEANNLTRKSILLLKK